MSVRALIGAIGKAGTGKTTTLHRLAARCRRLLVLDAEGGWDASGDRELEGAPALFAALRDLRAADPAVPFRLVYRDDADRLAVAGASAVFALRHCTLCIDELAWLCTAQVCPPALRRVVQFGRARQLNILFTSREPQEIHNLFLSQANRLYFFRVEPGLGLQRIRRWWPAVAERLPAFNEFPPPVQCCTVGPPAIERLLGREGLDLRAAAVPLSRATRRRRDA